MPRVLVTREDGEIFWNESVRGSDFDAEHFRRCLADRIAWAVTDAESGSPAEVEWEALDGPSRWRGRPDGPVPAVLA